MLITNQRQFTHWIKHTVLGTDGLKAGQTSSLGLNNEQIVEMKDIAMIESLVITKQLIEKQVTALLKIFILQVQGTAFKI